MADFGTVLHMRESGTLSGARAIRFRSYSTNRKGEERDDASLRVREHDDNIRSSKR